MRRARSWCLHGLACVTLDTIDTTPGEKGHAARKDTWREHVIITQAVSRAFDDLAETSSETSVAVSQLLRAKRVHLPFYAFYSAYELVSVVGVSNAPKRPSL